MIVMQAAAWFFPWPFTIAMTVLLAALAAAYTLMPGGRHNAPLRDWGADEEPAPREPAPKAIEGAGWAGHYQWRRPQLALPAAETLVPADHSAAWAPRFEAQPAEIIKFDGDLTEEQAEGFRARWEAARHGPLVVLQDCPTTFTPHDDGSGTQHACTCERTQGHPGKHLCPDCGVAWELQSESRPAAVTVTDDPPAGRHEASRAHPFTPGGDPYCGKCGKAGHWRGGQSCADAVVDELITRRRDDHVTAAIAGHLSAEGFRSHSITPDEILDSIIGKIKPVQP